MCTANQQIWLREERKREKERAGEKEGLSQQHHGAPRGVADLPCTPMARSVAGTVVTVVMPGPAPMQLWELAPQHRTAIVDISTQVYSEPNARAVTAAGKGTSVAGGDG